MKKLYEAMFLIDTALAAADWSAVEAAIEKILKRADAKIVSMNKWDERELAYPIGRRNRGTYILCYFESDGLKVQEIERDVQLSEQIIRVLILSADSMSQEDVEKETPAMIAEKRRVARSEAEAAKEAEKAAAAAEAPVAEVAKEEAATEETPEPEPVVEAAVAEESPVEPEKVAEEVAEPVVEEIKKETESEKSDEVAGQ